MSPFCESAKMAALPLNKFPCSKTAPPLPETTAHVLTSLPSPFYKSHCSPRHGVAPSFPWPAWQFGPTIKLCSMDVRLFFWVFFESGVFPNSQQCVKGSESLQTTWEGNAWSCGGETEIGDLRNVEHVLRKATDSKWSQPDSICK
jgi:hypothetical protein